MKQLKILLLMLSCALSYDMIIQANTDQQKTSSLSASEQEQIAQITELTEIILSKSFNALQKIENKLTELAIIVAKGKFTNHSKIMETLTENKRTLNYLLQNQATIIALKDPKAYLEYAYLLLEFCNEFIPYLNNHIKNNFKNIKSFNMTQFLISINKNRTRSNMQHLHPDSLKRNLKKTQLALKILNHTVTNIGLTWYNRLARGVDRKIVIPANKWHIPTILFYGGGAALSISYMLWSYGYLIKDRDDLPKWLTNGIKELYKDNKGPLVQSKHTGALVVVNGVTKVPSKDATTKQLKQPFPTNASGRACIDYVLKELLLHHQPLGAFAATYLFTSFKETWTNSIKPVLVKHRNDTWNFLRGGEYLKTHKPGITEIMPTVRFKDMVGLDEVKKAFYPIIQYIDNPEQLMRIQATPEKGWLLTGPSRTGKSFSVQCLCGEIKYIMEKRGKGNIPKFFEISAAQVNHFGIKAILEIILRDAPAIVFIDEIDLLGLQRVGNNALLSDFLTAMQSSMNADPSKVVIIIAATNKPENIDGALRQDGRFGKEIRFDYPSREYRIQYITRELTNMALDITQFDIEALADKTNNKTFEALKAVINNAMTRSWLNRTSLTQTLLENSIDTEIHNIITSDGKTLPENETRLLAIHFAGRALAMTLLKSHVQLDKVTIYAHKTDLKEEGVWEHYAKKDEKDKQQKIEYGYITSKISNDSINVHTQPEIIREATALIAGFAAEELLLGSCGFTCHSGDSERALKLIEDLVFGGLNHQSLPKSVVQELKTKAYTLLKQCHEDAMKILQEHKKSLEALVEELIVKRIMTSQEVQTIIDKTEGKTLEVITEALTENIAPEALKETLSPAA
ncbi:MAG TPA: AAA family ATPase [Candidatus Babeliales bacterium]|nr:AAA family ATPase [Candidatus Babeliales bacterium]